MACVQVKEAVCEDPPSGSGMEDGQWEPRPQGEGRPGQGSREEATRPLLPCWRGVWREAWEGDPGPGQGTPSLLGFGL